MDGTETVEYGAGACPVARSRHGTVEGADVPADVPLACPVSSAAADFDAFDGPFQVDPAEAMRWFRANEPVFWSPKLGYWVVTRYDQVKAVFRDTASFSPANALEKITPTCAEANAILARYGYAMDRTLVNEDEPAHTERRRALMHSFLPENLAHHEPMVRHLVREYVDRFIDKGAADLVDDMLWEVPLTVALHFLGVPEEDMATLRQYSIAHTVNTWGRPSPREQLEVANTVGRFWEFAGQVLDKMRRDPSGPGWMTYALRRQAELPDVIPDSYLHSMMMAGIVAAHETTANAAANALHLLLSDRDLWQQLCSQPALIPNAVEECLRMSGSIVAWRRVALSDTQVGGVAIPKGAKLLIVMTSGNHDERHFENPDVLDIYRDNTTDHLSFGYGSHQCMGKNLARMEIRIILEELTRRIPHMELVADQAITYLPNVSFRGPEHLLVRWNPEDNPERRDTARKLPRMAFSIGAPSKHDVARCLQLTELSPEAEDIVRLVLRDPSGRPLPAWSPGAHVDLLIGEYLRTYSLCGDPRAADCYEVAVLREELGRGGSRHIHTALAAGDEVRVRGPKNFFRLNEGAGRYLLVAGGIGVTPIIAMADRLKQLGKDYAIHYAGRTRSRMAFIRRLLRDHGGRLHLYVSDEGTRLDVPAIVELSDLEVYACGPHRLLADLDAHMADRRAHLHVELFSARGPLLDPEHEHGFVAELRDSGMSVAVRPDQTLLQVLRAHGIDVPSDCEEGLCGSCEVGVLAGSVDHRDSVLSAAERSGDARMMTCCSRARGSSLVLAL